MISCCMPGMQSDQEAIKRICQTPCLLGRCTFQELSRERPHRYCSNSPWHLLSNLHPETTLTCPVWYQVSQCFLLLKSLFFFFFKQSYIQPRLTWNSPCTLNFLPSLPPPPECRGYRCAPQCPVYVMLAFEPRQVLYQLSCGSSTCTSHLHLSWGHQMCQKIHNLQPHATPHPLLFQMLQPYDQLPHFSLYTFTHTNNTLAQCTHLFQANQELYFFKESTIAMQLLIEIVL